MAEPWIRSSPGQPPAAAEGRPGARRESRRGSVSGSGERRLMCAQRGALRSAAGLEWRSWIAGRSPLGRLLLVALPSGRALPSLPEESSERVFSSACFHQVWREEIRGTTQASSASPCCQGVAFVLSAVHPTVFAKGLKIKKEKKKDSENTVWWRSTHALLW